MSEFKCELVLLGFDLSYQYMTTDQNISVKGLENIEPALTTSLLLDGSGLYQPRHGPRPEVLLEVGAKLTRRLNAIIQIHVQVADPRLPYVWLPWHEPCRLHPAGYDSTGRRALELRATAPTHATPVFSVSIIVYEFSTGRVVCLPVFVSALLELGGEA
jgi:hypothetical protein